MENLAVFYKNKIIDILNEISEESVIIKKAAKVVAESIAREEPVHVYAVAVDAEGSARMPNRRRPPA